ncbi:RelA/SpoT family protein [Deinococcus aquiradiocola]|uniref:GTP pyrophosphokinase n=1 Tax=Deinococcus aquiradiocola TaxID=393059 RepID=A0A917PIF5_9DEIO|nr:bifunctional (p)ppGpp synthetase/guanosine-3',5'-bis(diphosphate) 3'-pyrophosphohydrolase [Deinococcus aquiradiocola]GGJ80369.1 GTP pyrophosphokinase [Deinococcus aquiradiocola]
MEALRPLIAERSPEERARIESAYEFARDAHAGVARKSGEPYITHPVAVAYILAELGMDSDSVIAGLLHDTVEDTTVTLEDVEKRFGTDVRRIVEGETKVSKLAKVAKAQDPDRTLSDEQSENMRKLLIAMTSDIRIIIVKLADRLHNMRTLGSMSPVKQQRIARETMEIFAPLAHRLGIGQVKWELEDLSFRYLEPDAYRDLQTRLRTRQEEREEHIRSALAEMRESLQEDLELEEWVDDINVSGRSKHLWSIYSKMQKEGKALEQIFDLLAIRVILTPRPLLQPDGKPRDPRKQERAEEVREKRVCYHSLSIVHSMWTPIPGRFKDYIAVPKPNGYQSLHTTVISPSGQPVEVQIRSRRMHEVAEFGVAAHWMYKQGERLGDRQKEGWLQRLQQLQHEILDASDFVDAVKDDLLGGRVVVFTPRGDTRDLPSGSTPIDFAYNVHSRIGDTATGARVNGSIVPLSYKLQNGDMVEIVTIKNGSPSKDWLSFAVTRSARTKIRHHFRAEERSEALTHGHDLLERYLRKRQLPVRQLMRTKLLEDVADKLTGNRNPDDLYLALHAGKLTTGTVARALAPQLEQERTPVRPPRPAPTRPLQDGQVYVEGTLTPAKRAMCCNPIAGDQIMAYVTRGRGYTIHRIDCPNMVRLLKDEPEDRCRPASWNPSAAGHSTVELDVVAADRSGLLADVLAVLVAQSRSPLKIEAGVRGPRAHILLRLEVGGQLDLSYLADAIKAVEGVQDVLRVGNKNGRSIPSEARLR